MASAVVVDQRCFLILELPYDVDERRTTLQRARELVLEHEAHVRRTADLLPGVNAAHTLARQLAATELTAAQQQLAAGVAKQLASLAESIGTLAPQPKGVRSNR